MGYISIEVDTDDILMDVDTDDLISELKLRNVKCIRGNYKKMELSQKDSQISVIRQVLGLREWHDKNRIIQEIINL